MAQSNPDPAGSKLSLLVLAMEREEISASNSHAVLISELTDLRRHLWTLIAVGKQVAHLLPALKRTELVEAMVKAEDALTK